VRGTIAPNYHHLFSATNSNGKHDEDEWEDLEAFFDEVIDSAPS
jgi:hypothetical protein